MLISSFDAQSLDISRDAQGTVWIGERCLNTKTWTLETAAKKNTKPFEHARDALVACSQQAGTNALRHLAVGVIGPREASKTQVEIAFAVGQALATLTVTTLCGGRSGVMEAVCQGVEEADGLSIGLLPGFTPDEANRYVGLPLPTGLSEGRNMVIARASRVLIAIGGSYGTLTEIAYGLHFGKTVIALDTAPFIEGISRAQSVDEAMELAAQALLKSAAS